MPAASASAAGAAEPAVAEAAGLPEPDELDEPPEPRQRGSNARAGLMKPLVVLALPGMYLFYKYSQYRREQRELSRRRVTERELQHLHHKIDKLLTKLEENEPEMASSQEDECVICVNARATMQTAPCGHRVVCRRCFVKTIQMAVSQRLLPLRCVICRAKILRLKQTLMPRDYSMSGKSWVLPQSASEYNMGAGVPVGVSGPGGRWTSGSVPASASLYSMASGSSSLSGVSSVSSATSSSASSTGSSGSSSLGKPSRVRQPVGATFRKTQTHSMKMRIQEYQDPIQPAPEEEEVLRENRERRLPPIKEFQRDYRVGKASTRLRCAQKIVTQLETAPPARPSQAGSSSATASASSSKSTGSVAATASTSKSSATTTAASSSSSSSSSNSASGGNGASKRSSSSGATPKKLTVAQEVQKTKKEKEREKEREKAEKARLKEEEKAEKARQKEAKKLAKEEKKRAKKEAKQRRKEAEEQLLRDVK
ncbi:chromatin assembly factor 1 subunit A [Nasonia vitripennis]|uniref:RING-type domain-containing protein n=2 Tax=Pteromalinae TaxID=272242 RepID=A0A7M7QZA1_NASVI|nr:chromatin assembly factor 1 subunit A [Nasonia vitripennis]XP_032456801.1 chromatin assembly factor 1 subunit A [Nasonia vitripennis]